MSGALWFYFWDNNPTWGVSASAASATASVGVPSPTIAGSGKGPDEELWINYDELWAIRERYLRTLFAEPTKRQKALTEDWPDAVLKPRRRR